jgi:cysteine desulfurase
MHGSGATRLPHLTNLGIAGCDGQSLLLHLDEAGFSVSAGSACSSGSAQVSHVLRAIGVAGRTDEASLRITVGRWTTAEDVDRFVEAAAAIIETLRSR